MIELDFSKVLFIACFVCLGTALGHVITGERIDEHASGYAGPFRVTSVIAFIVMIVAALSRLSQWLVTWH